MIGIASVAASFPGFSKWAFACAHSPATPEAASKDAPYHPLFFAEAQYRLVSRLADMIIPADETPGALEAGVPEFIDFMVANRVPVSDRGDIRSTQDAIERGSLEQTKFVDGLGWIDARSFSEFGHEFVACSPEQQTELLEELAYKDKFKPTTEAGQEFFRLIRDYTVVGYYTSKIGLEALGYPGLRTVWPAMPGCSHPDDPEHVRLPQPDS